MQSSVHEFVANASNAEISELLIDIAHRVSKRTEMRDQIEEVAAATDECIKFIKIQSKKACVSNGELITQIQIAYDESIAGLLNANGETTDIHS